MGEIHDEFHDQDDESCDRGRDLAAAGYARSDDRPCPDCGHAWLLVLEEANDLGIATYVACPACEYSDEGWYDTLELGGDE